MKSYQLIAVLYGNTSRFTFTAGSDREAMLEAIDVILERAMDRNIWRSGNIKLKDDRGNVISEMPAKA
jgi:hypothetical protein